MSENKFVKGYCEKTKQYYGLELKQYGSRWEVVNADHLTADEAKVVLSEVKQEKFVTHGNLIACTGCGNRTVGGCKCPPKSQDIKCKSGMPYSFQCIYCDHFVIDHSIPSRADVARHQGKVTVQGKEIKPVTFSNVEWIKFDNIQTHVSGRRSGYDEPLVHVIANEENIEFHGYNISQMDEGVYYEIGKKDDFEIECNVDTSTIQPHPGGRFYISFGSITANITQNGGSFHLDGRQVASVGSKFKMKLSLTDEGRYRVYINDSLSGEVVHQTRSNTRITFGFAHDSHHCELLSHAYLRGIMMTQGVSSEQ